MSFESLDQILRSISPPVAASQQDPFEQILALWPDLVGQKAARFSRPTRLSQGILQVATANAVWAQQLTFQRRHLLSRLNAHLDDPLQDIRLSPRLWHQETQMPEPTPEYQLADHPSVWDRPADPSFARHSTGMVPSSLSPQLAFEALLQKLAARTHDAPICPVCHSPTPLGELDRWSVCAVCAVSSPEVGR
ncbi:DUF721 domain-containing protein [Geitlerinema sp. P-1104]|uniref:DciA family protein n=1 Tax=Geitlerinema sp. P-1104 TaxID=2546230 RepID=UPI0014771632|nr:DUF721 domain-containing protein [Geitlerinema sp. P-1104]NMG58271.1 DUF721 domain-containing protein [Geitlerinema sp. P-1104]